MATINVSFDSSCNLQCPDITMAPGDTSIQWSGDSTVSSFTITNINPASAFSSSPRQGNGTSWNASLNSGMRGDITYTITAYPSNTRTCGTTSKQKAPKITTVAPIPVK